MGLIDRLFRKKKREESLEEEAPEKKEGPKTKTDLETICADDPEAYEALYNTMFLDPRKIGISMEEAAKKGDYITAGGLAIYAGNVERVKEYFGKYTESTGRKLKILEIPERAVKKAQEYYAKCLKE